MKYQKIKKLFKFNIQKIYQRIIIFIYKKRRWRKNNYQINIKNENKKKIYFLIYLYIYKYNIYNIYIIYIIKIN